MRIKGVDHAAQLDRNYLLNKKTKDVNLLGRMLLNKEDYFASRRSFSTDRIHKPVEIEGVNARQREDEWD